MAHMHTIEDHDKHFIIDPITKKIQPENPEKNKLVRYDHNSERYSFEMDRILEGHDMSLCDIVQIHYINVSSNKQKKNEDIYDVNDLGLLSGNEDRIVFTWLVSRNATMLDGVLTFAIRFACSNGDSIDYELHTEIFSSISISNTIINNGQAIVEEYSDILNQWKNELFGVEGIIYTAKRESLEAIDRKRDDTLNDITQVKNQSTKSVMDEGTKQIQNIEAVIDGIAQDTTAREILSKENQSVKFLETIALAAGKSGSLNGFGLEKGLNDSVVISYTNPETDILEGSVILPRDSTLIKIQETMKSINSSLKLIAIRNGVTL